mgnify:FL=1
MKEDKVTMSADQALRSLELLQQSQTKISLAARPPIWLSASAGFAYGLFTLSFSFSHDQKTWLWGVLISIVLFTGLITHWALCLKKRGIRGKLWPNSTKSRLTWVASALIFAVLISTAIYTAKHGYEVISALISIITGLSFTATLHWFPNYQFLGEMSCQGNPHE